LSAKINAQLQAAMAEGSGSQVEGQQKKKQEIRFMTNGHILLRFNPLKGYIFKET